MALPIKNFTNALVAAVNEAKRFRTQDAAGHWVFDPTFHQWEAARTDAEGKPARDAAELGLRLTAQAGQSPVVIPASLGPMTCLPFRDASGTLVQQRLIVGFKPRGNLGQSGFDPTHLPFARERLR